MADLHLILTVIAGPDGFDGGVIPMPLGKPEDVCVKELAVAYFLEDPRRPGDAGDCRQVGAAAQALARAGVLVEPAQPQDIVRDGREITKAWWELPSLRGQDVVELFNAWDAYRTRLLQFMQRYDAILCPVDPHPAPPFKERDSRTVSTIPCPSASPGWPAVVVRAGTVQIRPAHRRADCGAALAR